LRYDFLAVKEASMSSVGHKWPRRLFAAAILVLISAIIATTAWAAQPNLVPVLIGFNRQPGPAEEALVRRAGGSIKYTYHLVPGIAATVPENAIAGLRRNPNVTVVEPDGLFHKIDAELDNTWGVKRIGAGTVHASGNKALNVRVAIIDSGIDYNHPDLKNNYAGGFNFVGNNSNPMDDNGHGTHVAGTVAAIKNAVGVVGVAPEARLYGLKVLGANGSGSFSNVIKALQWAVDNGIKITNNSYGSSGDPGTLVKAAFDNSYAAGVLHIAAAGNSGNCSGNTNSVGYPARYASVVAVAATNQSDVRPCFSSTGPAVELSAPGVTIRSTKMGGGYVDYSGTSMASPHVAGVAALVLGTGATLSNVQVRDILTSTAVDLGAAGKDTHYGYGLVNAVAAVGGVVPSPAPAPAVNVVLSTDKASYLSGTDSDAILTAVVTDEYGATITGLGASAFSTKVDGSNASVSFSETATAGTYTGPLSLTGLANGSHNVSVTVANGSLSGSGAASFSIQSTSSATGVVVSSISYAGTGGKNNDRHLNITVALSDDWGSAVSGASVAIQLMRNGSLVGSASGTTGSAGTVSFTYKNAPSGTYTTEVANVAGEGLTWDGVTPENSFTK
jgi:subtilisin family serine protease